MSDRLTQLQDTVNLVRKKNLKDFHLLLGLIETNTQSLQKPIHLHFISSTFILSSKLNIFVTALVYFNNARCQVNSPGLNVLEHTKQIKIHKKITHNYFPH